MTALRHQSHLLRGQQRGRPEAVVSSASHGLLARHSLETSLSSEYLAGIQATPSPATPRNSQWFRLTGLSEQQTMRLSHENIAYKGKHALEEESFQRKLRLLFVAQIPCIFRLAVTTQIRLLTLAIFRRAKENVPSVNSPVRYQCPAPHLFCDSKRGNDRSTYCVGSSDLWTASIKGAL